MTDNNVVDYKMSKLGSRPSANFEVEEGTMAETYYLPPLLQDLSPEEVRQDLSPEEVRTLEKSSCVRWSCA